MFTRFMAGASAVLLSAASVLAQQAYEAPTLKAKEESTTVEWAIGAVFLLGCLVVAFKPAKRSNLQ